MLDDLAARLEATLRPADLRLSGAALCRRVGKAFRGEVAVKGLRRVDGDRSTLAVALSTKDRVFERPYFLFAAGSRVRAVSFSTTGEEGATLGEWRRRGDRIAGTFYDVQGNWSTGAVVALTRREGGWSLTGLRETEDEAAGMSFVGPGIERLRVSTRSYDFRRLSQAHVGPLLVRDAAWTIRRNRIAAGPSRLRRTPLYALDRFADAVLSGQGKAARALCAPGVYARAARMVRAAETENGRLSAWCPRSVEFDMGRFLGLGPSPTRYFVMVRRRGDWRIAGFHPEGSSRKDQERQRAGCATKGVWGGEETGRPSMGGEARSVEQKGRGR